MKFDNLVICCKNIKITRGLQTSLFLNGNTPYDLAPALAQFNGGAPAFCSAWATLVGDKFDGDFDKFYNRFDFDVKDKSEELTRLIIDIINRDMGEPIAKKTKKRRR